jgi:ribose transport system substrate-binding protein
LKDFVDRRKFVRLPAIALIALAVVAAGCGSSNNSSSSSSSTTANASSGGGSNNCQSQAEKLVTQQKQEVAWGNPGPAFDASKVKGKTIYWISLNADIPFTQSVFAGFKEAAQAAGAKFVFFNGAGNASQESRGVNQAVAAHADLIMIQSIPIPQISTAIRAANAAKIPVVEAFNTDAGGTPDQGTQAAVTYDYTGSGRYIADDAVRISKCKVNAVIFSVSDESVAPFEVKGMQDEFQKLCPSTCSAKIQDAKIPEWSTRLPVLARNAVASPSVNWLLPLYDGMTQFTDPAVKAAGASDRVKVASYNATKGIVDQLANSSDPLAIDIGSSLEWSGWAIADQSFRLLAGAKPVADEKIPLRTFDKDNIGAINLKQPEASWYGTKTDFKSEYRKLWGVG